MVSDWRPCLLPHPARYASVCIINDLEKRVERILHSGIVFGRNHLYWVLSVFLYSLIVYISLLYLIHRCKIILQLQQLIALEEFRLKF